MKHFVLCQVIVSLECCLCLVKLANENVVELDDDKKAAMVSNLLVVLCGDESAQPVVNTGTLNH